MLHHAPAAEQRRVLQLEQAQQQQESRSFTLLMTPAALLMGEDGRPPGAFNDMLVVMGAVETRGASGATKAEHEDDASTTRAAATADDRTILSKREGVKG